MAAESMNRKLFLKLTITGVTSAAVGCGSDEGDGQMGNSTMTATGGPTNTATNTSAVTNTSTTGTSTTTGFTSTTGSTTNAVTSTTSTTGTSTTGAATSTTGTATSTTGTSTTGTATSTTGTSTTGTATSTSTGAGGAGGMGNTSTTGSGGSCMESALMLEQTATTGMGHTHLPLSANETSSFLMMIDTLMPGQGLVIQGPDQHSHTLTFTQQDLMTLASGGELTGVVSSDDLSHNHTYTISCAGA